ncbi:MAG: rRNA maturation RNase YbeY [Candidatus Eremiobacteraeota bacterium]|nr:rRNA maturation RNase YbeY [Candidatus Eremiobacteraeota bacterium]
MIYFSNVNRKSGIDGRALKKTAKILLEQLHVAHASLSLSLVDDRRIRRLNRLHRGKDSATDVLSFPLMERDDRCAERLLGDVVISLETARRQARAYDAPLGDEVKRLLIHGILHVIGHDHERKRERVRMQAEERRLAAALALRWPYEGD